MINLKGIGWININFVSEILENYDGSYLLVMNNYSDTRGIERITEMQKDAIVDAINQVYDDSYLLLAEHALNRGGR